MSRIAPAAAAASRRPTTICCPALRLSSSEALRGSISTVTSARNFRLELRGTSMARSGAISPAMRADSIRPEYHSDILATSGGGSSLLASASFWKPPRCS